jgi:hypothetical protein
MTPDGTTAMRKSIKPCPPSRPRCTTWQRPAFIDLVDAVLVDDDVAPPSSDPADPGFPPEVAVGGAEHHLDDTFIKEATILHCHCQLWHEARSKVFTRICSMITPSCTSNSHLQALDIDHVDLGHLEKAQRKPDQNLELPGSGTLPL